jgi:bla regulator protein blaR1
MTMMEITSQSWFSPMMNHLWQSTAVVLAVWVLALALRRNRAAVRYGVWMVASIKFLVPFSIFEAIGEMLRPRAAASAPATAISMAVAQMAQPFEPAQQASAWAVSPSQSMDMWPSLLVALWAGGALVIVLRWWRSWRQIRIAARAATPCDMDATVPVLLSNALMEPGVFGTFRPVLLLPRGIASRLTESQLNAIVEHEMCHVRRRDNLTFALHMIVEALFWFHPLVWWVGTRLVEERERACDEAVLERGNEAEIYAESILSVCKFCVESPLPCAAGVSGSDLKKRIVRIMSEGVVSRLGMSRRILLSTAGLVAIALPTAIGIFHAGQTAVLAQAQDAPADIPKFDVASIKPNKSGEMRTMMGFKPDGVSMNGVTTQMMLTQAFQVEDDRIVGAPSWVNSDHFDVEAKIAPEDATKLDRLKPGQRMEMLQPFLQDRFGLKFHHETREMPVYVLEAAKGGSKLKQAEPEAADGNDGGGTPRGMMRMGIGNLEANGAQVDMLVHTLSREVGRTIIDKTGLTGKYDFNLHFTPANMPAGMGPGPGAGPGGGHPGADAPPPSDTTGPDIFTAIQEQLGLKLVSAKGPVDVIVIDHIDRPSGN